MNFAKFLIITPIFTEHVWWLLLDIALLFFKCFEKKILNSDLTYRNVMYYKEIDENFTLGTRTDFVIFEDFDLYCLDLSQEQIKKIFVAFNPFEATEAASQSCS